MNEQIYGSDDASPFGDMPANSNGEAQHTPADRGKGLIKMIGVVSEEILENALVGTETPPEFAKYIERRPPPLLFVLTGPSGVGKDVTLKRMKELGMPFHKVVTVTTREQRPGEVEGVDYQFVSKEEYKRLLDNNELLEHAEVYGNSYGIPRSQVVEPLRRGEDVVMKPDVQGASKMRELEPEAVFIFLAPPSMEEQVRRLFYRKTEDPQELATRLNVARQEMHELTHFDYLVVNRSNKLDETVHTIEAIMLAEKCRVQPRKIRMVEESG